MPDGIDRRPPAIFLMGPTASGKTDLALALADRFPLGLVSADSALVYRGFDIGSAKPDAATLARYPHALIDIREPDQPFSAGEFRDQALAAMAGLQAQARVPLLVCTSGPCRVDWRCCPRPTRRSAPSCRCRVRPKAGRPCTGAWRRWTRTRRRESAPAIHNASSVRWRSGD